MQTLNGYDEQSEAFRLFECAERWLCWLWAIVRGEVMVIAIADMAIHKNNKRNREIVGSEYLWSEEKEEVEEMETLYLNITKMKNFSSFFLGT